MISAAQLSIAFCYLLAGSSGANAQFLDGLLAIPRSIQCYLRYNALGFELTNYDAYPRYFREDSVMILAQSGTYEGVDAIREYVSFTAPTSPYLLDVVVVDSATRVGGYDSETGQCVFDLALRRRFVSNPDNTNPDVVDFDGFSMAKLFFDLENVYITRINLLFPSGIIEKVFVDVLESDNTRAYICDILEGPCAAYVTGHNPTTCAADLAALPASEDNYVDGNSSGCRALHAAFAILNPAVHCAHVSLSTTDIDNNGKNKCSVSEGVPVESLIGESDMAFYRQFAESQGVDPDVGVITPSPSIVEPNWLENLGDTFGNLLNLLFGGF